MFWCAVGWQEGPTARERGAGVDRGGRGQEVPSGRGVRGCPAGRSSAVRAHEQAETWLHQEDQHLGGRLQTHGEH